jgi:hypothetical protein
MAGLRQVRQRVAGDRLPRSRVLALARLKADTVPSSSQRQAIAVVTAGVFQVVTLIARSIEDTAANGAATKPMRRPSRRCSTARTYTR